MTIRDYQFQDIKDNFNPNAIPQIQNFKANYMGRGVVRYNYNSGGTQYIAQTGSNVATGFGLANLSHKLLALWIVITNSSNVVDNTGPNTLSLTHGNYNAATNETIWANTNTATGSFQAIFDQNATDSGDAAYLFMLANYTINTNCPNTDRAYVTVEVYFPDWRDFETPSGVI